MKRRTQARWSGLDAFRCHPREFATARVAFFLGWALSFNAVQAPLAFSLSQTLQFPSYAWLRAPLYHVAAHGTELAYLWYGACAVAALGIPVAAILAGALGLALQLLAGFFHETRTVDIYPFIALLFGLWGPTQSSYRAGVSLSLVQGSFVIALAITTVAVLLNEGVYGAGFQQFRLRWLLDCRTPALRVDTVASFCTIWIYAGMLLTVVAPIFFLHWKIREALLLLVSFYLGLDMLLGRAPFIMLPGMLVLAVTPIFALNRQHGALLFASGDVQVSDSPLLGRGYWRLLPLGFALAILQEVPSGRIPFTIRDFWIPTEKEVIELLSVAVYDEHGAATPVQFEQLIRERGCGEVRRIRAAASRGEETAGLALWYSESKLQQVFPTTAQFFIDTYSTDPDLVNFNPVERAHLLDAPLRE